MCPEGLTVHEMLAKPSTLRRNSFVALLVLMTLLPLVVYLYTRERGRRVAAQRLVEHVERSVNRALQVKGELEAILRESGPRSKAVKAEMERLTVNDDSIGYIQLVDSYGRVLNSTLGAPRRHRAPITVLPPAAPDIAAPEMVRRLGAAAPEYVVHLRLSETARGHMLVGMSAPALDKQLARFQDPIRWASLHIAVICVAILAAFSAYIVYINERARALHAQLQEESRLAYVGTLAAGIAHEVRNPLSSVKMNVHMIENRLAQLSDAEQAEYFRGKVERIKGEVDRLENSVSHFLAFARPAPLRPKESRFNDLVDNVLDLLQLQCQSRGVRLVRRYARDLPAVELDPQQFVQAVENLVLNAAQVLARGGTITVTTESADEAVVLTVSDDGPGIPEEVQDKIFDVFFTTREGGTGLGLNIVSRIVEEHRGKLSLESKPGEGATFRIELPVSRVRAASEEEA